MYESAIILLEKKRPGLPMHTCQQANRKVVYIIFDKWP